MRLFHFCLNTQQEYHIGSEASVEGTLQEEKIQKVLNPADLAGARKDKNHINQRDAHGATELHKAVQSKRADLVRDLLHRGAHIDARDFKDQIPLIVALSQDNVELVELLIASGANIEASHPLHWTVKHNRIALAKILLRSGTDLKQEQLPSVGVMNARSNMSAVIIGVITMAKEPWSSFWLIKEPSIALPKKFMFVIILKMVKE